MSVTVIYEFRAAAGKAADLLEVLRGGQTFARTVDGCEGFDICQAAADPHRLMMIETWSSVDAHQDHFQKNVQASGVLDRAVELMASPPDMSEPYYARQ